ncbi:MAG: hypothetical protein KAR24_01665 [Candidatus Pacebacteria bacterium]|nr:hypothetical protein [Candidatus Paceibacterota bacterium]
MKKLVFFVFVFSVCFVSFAQAQTTTSSTTVTVSESEEPDYSDDQKRRFTEYCTKPLKPYAERWNNDNIEKYCQPEPVSISATSSEFLFLFHDGTKAKTVWGDFEGNYGMKFIWQDVFFFYKLVLTNV